MVIWIIGLSGTGKSYLARKIFKNLKNKKKIIIDGDEVRKYITKNLKYSKKDRLKNSLLIMNLCNFLEKKGFCVICSILSIFPNHQRQNRKIFNKYFQIYMQADKKYIMKRNNKRVYNRINVVGKDINFPKPYKSDLIINNHFKKFDKKIINLIIKKIS